MLFRMLFLSRRVPYCTGKPGPGHCVVHVYTYIQLYLMDNRCFDVAQSVLTCCQTSTFAGNYETWPVDWTMDWIELIKTAVYRQAAKGLSPVRCQLLPSLLRHCLLDLQEVIGSVHIY